MPADRLEERLIGYLLGELPEAESLRIEEEYLAADDALAPLLAVEAELYDAYARDDLSPERRRRFEQRFLATPEQRQRLEFSRALLKVPLSTQPKTNIRTWLPSIAALTAVAAVVIAVVFWRQPITPQPSPSAQQPPAAQPLIVVSLALGAGISRDGGEESTLDLPANADEVRVTASLDQDVRPPVAAVLHTPEGVEVWKSDSARPPLIQDARSLIVEIPATRLPSGHYILKLSAPNSQGVIEDVADYAFRVVRR